MIQKMSRCPRIVAFRTDCRPIHRSRSGCQALPGAAARCRRRRASTSERQHESGCSIKQPWRCQALPAFLPPAAAEITDTDAVALLAQLEVCPVAVQGFSRPVNTVFAGPARSGNGSPIVLIPGFDVSCLDFRYLKPRLDARLPCWAVDLLGWGFTDGGFAQDRNAALGPQQKRDHLHQFWKDKIRRPMTLVGTSLGGAIAMDFALEHPHAVERLVLLDSQGYADGLGALAKLPRFATMLAISLLKAPWLRKSATKMAYFDKQQATEEAVTIGSLHTMLPGWANANAAFIKSGGYSMSRRIKDIQQETLVIWGEDDEILDPKYAQRFAEEIPNSRLVMLKECGHSPHIEKVQQTAELILDFVGLNASPVEGAREIPV